MGLGTADAVGLADALVLLPDVGLEAELPEGAGAKGPKQPVRTNTVDIARMLKADVLSLDLYITLP